ncbi:MAG: hypothetical protein WCT18_00280 [Patescibacteria group bacterium]
MLRQKANKNKIIEKMNRAYEVFASKMAELQQQAEQSYRDGLKKVEKQKIAEALAQIKNIVNK